MDTEANLLLDSLKKILKDRRISYQSIADTMEISLPTVKRMLNKPNLPLDRFFGICEIAGIPPEEIFSLARARKPKHTTITNDQDQLFAERPEFLAYFMELFDQGKPPEQIAAENDLSTLSTGRYLSGLEQVGLIERGTGDTFKFLVSPPIGFGPDSKVLRATHADFLKHTVDQVLTPESAKGSFAIMKPLHLQRSAYREMVNELTSVVDKYAYLSEHTGNRDLSDREPWNLAIATGPEYPENRASIVNI